MWWTRPGRAATIASSPARPMRLTIRWRFVLFIAVPLLLIYLGVLGSVLVRIRDRSYREAEARATERAAQDAGWLDGRFEVLAQVARSTATHLAALPDLGEEDLYRLVEGNLDEHPLIYRSCIVTGEPPTEGGRCLSPCAVRGEGGPECLDIGCDPDAIPDGGAAWTEPFFEDEVSLVVHAVPILGSGGRLRGAATIAVSLEDLQEQVDALETEREIYLVSREGTFIVHPRRDWILDGNVYDLAERHGWTLLAELAGKALSGETGTGHLPGPEGDEMLWVSYAPVPSAGWTLAVSVRESEAMGFVYGQLGRAVGGMALSLVLIVVCVWFVASRITRPISRLASAVGRLGAGNLEVRVPEVETRDEIGDLTGAFNRMVGDLKRHVEALTRETAAREAVEGELRVARSIQTSLLPRTFPPFPERGEFDLHAVNVAAKHVAGDFYDFFFRRDGKLVLVLADVSGKGAPAALFMAVARTVLRNFWSQEDSPARVLTLANDRLLEDNVGSMFVTVFTGTYDTGSGLLRYANAGHPPAYRIGAGGRSTPSGRPRARSAASWGAGSTRRRRSGWRQATRSSCTPTACRRRRIRTGNFTARSGSSASWPSMAPCPPRVCARRSPPRWTPSSARS